MKRNTLHWCMLLAMMVFLATSIWVIYGYREMYQAASDALAHVESMTVQQREAEKRLSQVTHSGNPEKGKENSSAGASGDMVTEDREALRLLAAWRHSMQTDMEEQQDLAKKMIWWQVFLVTLGLYFSLKAFHLLEELYVNPLKNLAVSLDDILHRSQWDLRVPPYPLPLLNLISVRCNHLTEMRNRLQEKMSTAYSLTSAVARQLLDLQKEPMALLQQNGDLYSQNSAATQLPFWWEKEFQESLGQAFRAGKTSFVFRDMQYDLSCLESEMRNACPYVVCRILCRKPGEKTIADGDARL